MVGLSTTGRGRLKEIEHQHRPREVITTCIYQEATSVLRVRTAVLYALLGARLGFCDNRTHLVPYAVPSLRLNCYLTGLIGRRKSFDQKWSCRLPRVQNQKQKGSSSRHSPGREGVWTAWSLTAGSVAPHPHIKTRDARL